MKNKKDWLVVEKKITSEKEYKGLFQKVKTLAKSPTTHKDIVNLKYLAKQIERLYLYEQSRQNFPLPVTIADMLHRKMYELKMNQEELAKKMGVKPTDISYIIKGRRKPSLRLIKAMYCTLDIDPSFLLENV